MEELERDTILANLQILNDEPISNPLFNFQVFGDQLSKILLDKTTPTTFAIGLDGEWGSGKSTLLLYLENLIEEEHIELEKKSWKIICFNAWKYEKLDPVGSLMQVISNEYENEKGNEKWKEIVKNYGILALSTGLKITFGIDDLKPQFSSSLLSSSPFVSSSSCYSCCCCSSCSCALLKFLLSY